MTTLLARPKLRNQKPINLIDSSVCIVAGCNEHHLRFGFPCNFSSNWQTECKKSKEVFFFAVIDLFPLRVRFSLLKCLLWEKHCNYLMTTTQGDRFASCENIVSRSQNSSSPPGRMMKYFNKLRRLICCSSNSSSFSIILLCIKLDNIPTTNENKIKLVWTTKEKFEPPSTCKLID